MHSDVLTIAYSVDVVFLSVWCHVTLPVFGQWAFARLLARQHAQGGRFLDEQVREAY